jgi:hypothetical protein
MSGTNEFRPEALTYGSDNEETLARLRELMLFVAERCLDDPKFGVTKLNKILFYCDFTAFAKFGKPITGISYNKLPYGPVPTGAESTRRQMERDDEIFVTSEGYSPFRIKRIVPRRTANLDMFSGPEVALIDGVINALAGTTGSQARDLSHGNAWRTAEMHGAIPYEAVFISDEPYTEADIARAHELITLGELED